MLVPVLALVQRIETLFCFPFGLIFQFSLLNHFILINQWEVTRHEFFTVCEKFTFCLKNVSPKLFFLELPNVQLLSAIAINSH